jgi:pimeloyl-ACP methyl ester carboxylesterase
MADGDATVVLVHGAWHGPWAWDAVADGLEAEGVDVVLVDLPSSGPDAGALGDMSDDAAAVRAAIDGVDGPVVVMAHSYGGVPTTQGAAGAENVEHLIYLTSFMLDEGESLFGLVGGVAPPWWIVDDEERSTIADTPDVVFYNGIDAGEAAAASARLVPQSLASFKGEVTSVAWRDIDSTYVICDDDQAIPVPAQEMLAQRAGTVHRLDASHSPMLSHADEVVAIVRGVL